MSDARRNAVLEVGTSEIPASYLPDAIQQLDQFFVDACDAAGLSVEDIRVWATPRRLVGYFEQVSGRGLERVEEVRGPSESVAFSDAGEPTKAAAGFARSQGVKVDDLEVREDEKGRYVYAVVRHPGQPAEQILSDVFTRAMREIRFPRTMRWGVGEHAFARPVRWVLALFGEDVVSVDVAGISSARYSYGPRFAATHLQVMRAEDYPDLVQDAGVILDHAVRRQRIITDCERVAASEGLQPLLDDDLLNEVNFLVEHPSVLMGVIPDAFMDVPRVVIETAMMSHLRFFPVEDGEGTLAPRFLSVINGTRDMRERVRPGNELVLNSRLADARFFWEEDLKRSLDDYAAELGTVVFHEALGSLADRTERMRQMADCIVQRGFIPVAEAAHLQRAVQLSKADLVTLMVGEFPDLQGRMGEEYARVAGEPEAICRAIGEQYLPAGSGDEPPATTLGRWLALIDKMDHLVGAFRTGLVGSGSEDPYGVRRTATGILRILEGMSNVCVSDLLRPALGAHGVEEAEALRANIREFLGRRLARLLWDAGFQLELVNGILRAGWDDVSEVWSRANQLDRFLGTPAAEDALVVWRRCRNLGSQGTPLEEVDPDGFPSEEGKALALRLVEFEQQTTGLLDQAEYLEFLERAAELRPPVDAFLDSVMVMVDDEGVRANRLGLLARIDALLSSFMEWSELPG